jgi:Spy/CpxP family protein refolding chaperone
MKKIIIALSFALITSAISAQDTSAVARHMKATPEQIAQHITGHLEKKVSLTAEQKPKVYDLALANATKMNAIREKYKDQPEKKEERQKEMKAARDEYKAGLKTILSPEQCAKLDSMKQGHEKHSFTPEQKAQRTVDKLDETLKLSPDQKKQVYDIALIKTQKKVAIHEKYKNLPDQKEQALTEMKAVHNEFKMQLKPILTPEQAALLDAKKKEHHKEGKNMRTVPSIKETEIPK